MRRSDHKFTSCHLSIIIFYHLSFIMNSMDNTPKILSEEILSDNWYILKKVTFEYTKKDGEKVIQTREAYDRGNGATILLYNKTQKTVILTRQFRVPTLLNGNVSGMMIEAIAGLLDDDEPDECIRRETEEETGYVITNVQRIFQTYMSPGSVTEILFFYIGAYTSAMKVNEGGGIDGENIEVLELPFDEAYDMIRTGEIKDAKTVMLLQHLRVQMLEAGL